MAEPQSPTTASNQNMMGALAYLLGPITGIVLLVIEKQNNFVRFHAMQSTIALGGLWILQIVIGFIPFVGLLTILLAPVQFVLWLILMYKAYSGEMYKLPYVGVMAEQQLTKMK